MTTNTDTLHRLYIHIANAGEIINMGFKKLSTSGDARFRIKMHREIVYLFTNIPKSIADT